MKILVAGFKPYSTYPTNPSEEVLPLIEEDDVVKTVFDVSYERAQKELMKQIGNVEPDAIILVALSPFINEPAIERYAYNEMDSVEPDMDGVVKSGEPVIKGGASNLLPPVDVTTIDTYVTSQGNSIYISLDPGKYVANAVFYRSLSAGIPTVMVHIPFADRFPLDETRDTLVNVIEYLRGCQF